MRMNEMKFDRIAQNRAFTSDLAFLLDGMNAEER